MALLSLLPGLGFGNDGSQSLAELARKEAERRRALKEQGIWGKVIESGDLSLGGNSGWITTSDATSSPSALTSGSQAGKNAARAGSYRTRLQSLDRQIRQNEEQLRLLKARMAAERWAPPKVGRITRNQRTGSSFEDLRWKALQLEAKLKQLRTERLEVYEQGRKAGFLPGELEGKRITP
jgi:hypothetical protein